MSLELVISSHILTFNQDNSCFKFRQSNPIKMKAVVLDKFATVGLPDFDTPGLGRNWSIVALSQQLIDEKLLKNVHYEESKTRSLDLVVIGNENKIALLNLQAFKLFPSHLATSMIRQSLAHHFTEDGSLLFGIQTSGDLFVVTDHLKTVKHIRRPYFIKLSRSAPSWYSRVSRRLSNMVGFLTENNLVVPEEVSSQRIMISSWLATSQKFNGIFPLITSLPDGFAVFCALSPQDCFIFLTSYETALRQRSIGNFKGNSVPGRWHRILMDRSFIRRWLEEKDQLWFEAQLCSSFDEEDNEVIGGAMLYAVPVNTEFHLVYGIISRLNSHFRLAWEIIHFELDCPLVGESKDASSLSLGSRFFARLSSDCTKIAVVINTHVAAYVHVENLPAPFYELPVKLTRRRVPFCPHGDYDGTQFFKRECWVSDIQWIAEDGYFAVMTQCGCLSIFHSSGSPMIIKTKLPERSDHQNPDEEKSARFYLPVFQRQQISARPRRGQPPYPTLKWVKSQQVLSCSSGLKIELFSLKRVFNLNDDFCEDEELMSRCSAMNSDKLVRNDSLTLLYAPMESQASGFSETDKESLPEVDIDDVRVSVYPTSPRRGGRTEGEMGFQHCHNSVYTSLLDTKFKPKFTPAPPTSANEHEVVVSPVFVYREHKTPIKYVSVEDDEYDIYGDCSTTTSGGSGGEENLREVEDDGIAKDVVSTVEKLVSSCDEDEEEVKEESTPLFTQTSADRDKTLNNNVYNLEYDHSTNSAVSIESAPEPETSFDPDHVPSPQATPRGCLSLPDLDTRFDLRIQTKSRVDLSPQPPSTVNTITTVESYSPPFTCTSIPTSTDDDDARQNVQVEETWSSQLELKIPSVPSILGVVVSQRKLVSVETFVQTVPVKISELVTVEEVGLPYSPIAPVKNNEERDLKEKVSASSSSGEPVTEEEEESELDILQVDGDPQGFNESAEVEAENNNNISQFRFDELKEKQEDDKNCQVKDEAAKLVNNLIFLSQSCSAVGCQTQTAKPSKDNHGTQTLRHTIKSEKEVEVAFRERCRPYCIITEPPPPTSISDTGPLSQTSRHTLQGEQLEFNKAALDQMTYKSILVPDAIRKSKRKRSKKVTLVEGDEVLQKKQLMIEQEENNNENRVSRSISLSRLSEEAIEKIVAATTEDEIELQNTPSGSKEIWEQAARQFQQKVNRFVKEKRRRCSSSTSVSIDSELELEETVKMLGSLPNIKGEAMCQVEAEPHAIEVDGFELKENQYEPDAQEQLNSIPKTDDPTKQSRTWNRILWLRNGEPPVEKFQGRTLPYDASSDTELVEELKRRLQKLKFQQEQCKISGNRELTKFMSSWALASESVLPDLNLQDMMIQPVVFPEPMEPSPEIKPELDHQSPLSPPNLSSPAPQQHQQAAKEPPQMSKSQPVFVFPGPPSLKRNQSHQIVNNKNSGMGMSQPYPHPLLLPQTPKKKVHRPQAIYIAPSMQLPLPNFTLRSPNQSQKKAKRTSISAGKTKASIDLTANRSSSHFVKTQPGTTKITKSPIQTYPLTPRVNSTTSAIIQSAQFQSLLNRRSVKKTGCAACSQNFFNNSNNTSTKNDGRDKRRTMKTFVAKVKRVANVENADVNLERTVDLDKLMDLRGKLPVVPEPVEKIPIGGGGSSQSGGNDSYSQGKGSWIGYKLGESSERDKLSRRVSFSDPIAIVKTMSPSDLKDAFQLEDNPSVDDWTWP
ncbi:unnamed protein product [Orchesella dallaii]|uniref:Uncharacterized protein n=1 Tax=Orchesella dallaii TaxID=48710 RepID=A0ABP1RDE2_9HEXA